MKMMMIIITKRNLAQLTWEHLEQKDKPQDRIFNATLRKAVVTFKSDVQCLAKIPLLPTDS